MSGSKISIKGLCFYYGDNQAIKGLDLDIAENEILALLGPAKSGITTLLRSLNRLCDIVPHTRTEGSILLDGKDISGGDVDITELRRRVGMVFDVPTPLPMSIFDNVAYGLRLGRNRAGAPGRARDGAGKGAARGAAGNAGAHADAGAPAGGGALAGAAGIAERVEGALRTAALWEDVKDRLQISAMSLSGGQQQRLCIARVLALDPEVILLDRPCSGLDPISTANIEESLMQLKEKLTVVIAPHNVQQAARISDRVAFMLMGELIEHGTSAEMFSSPKDVRTSDYITGRYG